MKLVIAIVHDDDSNSITSELVKSGFRVTKLCSSGGFLRKGNTTLLIGVRNSKVNSIIEIIKSNSKCRKYTNNYTLPSYFSEYMDSNSFEVSSSNCKFCTDISMNVTDEKFKNGAVIFVLNVENFNRVLLMR